MACVRLDRVPRNGYCCPKCYQEEEEFSNLKFTVGDHFEVGCWEHRFLLFLL